MKRFYLMVIVVVVISGCGSLGPEIRMKTLQAWMPDGCYYSDPKNQFTCTDDELSRYLNSEGKLSDDDLEVISSLSASDGERARVLFKIYDCGLLNKKNVVSCKFRFGLPHLTSLREDWDVSEEFINDRYVYTMNPKA